MEIQPQQQLQTGFFDKKRNILISMILLAVMLAVFFVGLYFYAFGIFKSDPKVEIKALNQFESTLHVVTDIDYAPYSYVDANGEYAGLDVEMMNEIANRMQMNLDLKLMDWSIANKLFIEDKADIIMNMESDIIINNPNIIATLPTTEKQYVVYGRNQITSVAELYGRRVASLHPMPGLGLDDEIAYINSYERIFEGLKKDEYEFAICPIQVGNSFIEKLDIKDVFPSYAVSHVYGTLAIHPEDTMLRVKLNAVLIQMQQEGKLAELDKKWILQRYENITLTEMIKNRPWLVFSIVMAIFMVMALVFYIVVQYRNARTREAYTIQLQENFETINSQQKELIIAKTRAEEGSKAKTMFLSNMSHDLRTPMNAIIGYINLAKSLSITCETCTRPHCPDNVPSKLQDFLTKIGTSSQHLLTLINDVLEMSRIESGKMELELADMDLRQTLIELQDMFATQMQNKHIDFVVDSSKINDRYVYCDKNRLNRVLLNLVSNAFKFTPENGKISITLIQKESEDDKCGEYELRVKDTGIGMAPEFAAKVFEAFERERTSTVSGIQGTGLGMAITKSIIDLMHGTIRVETEPNKGTEFIINVKFNKAEPPAPEVKEQTHIQSQNSNFAQKKLLLVEDVEVNREIALMILTDAGFTVDIAVDGKEAVDKIAAANEGDYDAILMDIQMPIMNGYEATKAIRAMKDSPLSKIPIVAMTANAFSEDIQAAKDAGMNAHIAKPIDIPKMQETLNQILNK